MPSRRGKARQQANRHHARTDGAEATTGADASALPTTLARSLRAALGTQLPDQGALAALAARIEALAPDDAGQAVLETLAAHLDGEALVEALEALLHEPLDPAIHEQVIRLLERSQEPKALQVLVAEGEHGQARVIRRAAKGALFRLSQAGVALPTPVTAPASQQDASAWPVARAWANRIDAIGSQAVGIARQRPQGEVAFISVIVSDDRGVVDGMGEFGTSLRAVDRLAQRIAIPPGAPLYEVTPEYVRYRICQGLASSARAGRTPAPDYRRWSFLLDGIDDTWEPDLEGLCRDQAQPSWLERTEALIYAVEFSDWWPDPEGPEGGVVRRLTADVRSALARLPDGGYAGASALSNPPYLDLLTETHFIAQLWPFNGAGSAAIEKAIDRHFASLLPRERIARFRDALLQMGYPSYVSDRPTLCTLVMTAAWALDPASGIDPRRHPFLRQTLRKAIEVLSDM